MKRNLIVIGMVIMMALLTSNAFADPTASGYARVTATIVDNVTIGAVVPQDAEGIQTGTFEATVSFAVASNNQTVNIGAAASDLWKGDVPSGSHSIPVDEPSGILVAVASANATDGDNTLDYTGPGTPYLSFPMTQTEVKPFENNVSNQFVDDVLLTVTWSQVNPSLPTGVYSGWVCLQVMTI